MIQPSEILILGLLVLVLSSDLHVFDLHLYINLESEMPDT